MIHILKTRADFWERIRAREKTAEMREERDRDFQVGDFLHLTAVDKNGNNDVQRGHIDVAVSHVLRGTEWGMRGGWAMISFHIVETCTPTETEG